MTASLEEPMTTTQTDLSAPGRKPRSRWTWPAVLAAGLMGAGLAFVGFSFVQSPEQASATVLINPTLGNPYSPTSDNLTNVQSDAAIVTSDAVVSAVAESVDGATLTSLAGRIKAAANLNSQVITITSTGSGNPPNAYLVREFARAYLDAREATTDEKVASRAKVLGAQIETAEEELVSASEAAAEARAGSPTELVLTSRVRVASEALASLYNELASTTATSTDPGRILSVTLEPRQGTLWVWILGGFVLGSVAGFTALKGRRMRT
jgi:hypothetical protein